MLTTPIAYLNSDNRHANRPLRLAILGATGSIGSQTLDLIASHRELFELVAITTNRRIERAVAICHKFRPKVLVITDTTIPADERRKIAADIPATKILWGSEAMNEVTRRDDIDMVVTATVGYSGLLPTLAAIDAGKDIALANKETLVVAGDYIRKRLEGSNSRIFPIDSEHSAIAQCLRGEDISTVSRLIITASGGPFRTWDINRLQTAKASDALKHPNWEMGAKITIDSATMMNKAFEIIEAHYLYGIAPSHIKAVVHPQSIVHSMVEFIDGALKAQLGLPDMHLPIAYALGMNTRMAGVSPAARLTDLATLTFERPDETKFPCLTLASVALKRRGNIACIINGANEVAVDAFLRGTIRFTDIYPIISGTIERIPFVADPTPDDFIETNAMSRRIASELTKIVTS